MTDRRWKDKRRKGNKLTLFDIAWAIERWIAGETQTQIGKSLGYANGSYVSTRFRLFVMRNLPKDAYEKYGPSEMHTKPSARKELARLALEAYCERAVASSGLFNNGGVKGMTKTTRPRRRSKHARKLSYVVVRRRDGDLSVRDVLGWLRAASDGWVHAPLRDDEREMFRGALRRQESQ